ncbi:MAG: alpha/beta hydrolase [Lentisphaeraceae bacterium]|nr:alpha/beta hydrolase [Lentisphaeraceae bacterium]
MRILLVLNIFFSYLCFGDLPSKKSYKYEGMLGEQSITVYFPENHKIEDKAPCLVFFHGGGWSGGSPNQFRSIAQYFAKRGAVCVTPTYSKNPKAKVKNLPKGESRKRVCVIDGKSVMRWVVENAAVIGIDKDKIAAGGASAGGHISVLSFLDKEYNNPNDSKVDFDVKAFLLYCPAFSSSSTKPYDVSVYKNLPKKLPPMLFIVGEKDSWKKGSDSLVKAVTEQGTEVRHLMGPGEKHMFYGSKDWGSLSLLASDQFLIEKGILTGTPTAKSSNDNKLVLIK